ncbi:MAG: ATP-dependent DNA helicase RecG [Planctomycetes bacterium]|nr:ATP-dependent DNA helicase RecG [Planctomycetota bacterium]
MGENSINRDKFGLTSPLEVLSGVGTERAKVFAQKLNIYNAYDLLMHLPFRYEDLANMKKFADLKVGEKVTIRAKVIAKMLKFTPRQRRRILEVVFGDETAQMTVTFFNYRIDSLLRIDQEVMLSGKTEYYKSLQLTNPEVYQLDESEAQQMLHPVYHASEDLNIYLMRKVIAEVVKNFAHELTELIPAKYLKNNGFYDIEKAIKTVHKPISVEDAEKARESMNYHEFFYLQAALAWRKSLERPQKLKPIFTVSEMVHDRIINILPFEPTPDQFNAFNNIREDVSQNGRMMRLLQGDVGTGKTVVALYAALAATAGKHQTVFMAPTEVLANQHFDTFNIILGESQVRIALLTGSMKTKQRDEIISNLNEGELDIIIGTHALIEPDVKFKKLGVVIIDEQHKFGVQQRHKLQKKGHHPHVLVMTATPIPRTLALTVYGDLDVTTLKERPTGYASITTKFIEKENMPKMFSFIQGRLLKKEQAFYVCPFVEEGYKNGEKERKSVLKLTSVLRKVYTDFKIEPLFGKMKPEDKEKTLKTFSKGEIDILVSSTVMEVGIDVPNATMVIIEDAHRFGLSQLHQIRGRVGRGGKDSFCFLVADPQTDEAKQRLRTILKTNDGFEIAEQDLEIRGSGETYGLRQSGVPYFKFANPLENFDLLVQARNDAQQAFQNDELDLTMLREIIRLHFSTSFTITTMA